MNSVDNSIVVDPAVVSSVTEQVVAIMNNKSDIRPMEIIMKCREIVMNIPNINIMERRKIIKSVIENIINSKDTNIDKNRLQMLLHINRF
jgi:hypothetical protein